MFMRRAMSVLAGTGLAVPLSLPVPTRRRPWRLTVGVVDGAVAGALTLGTSRRLG